MTPNQKAEQIYKSMCNVYNMEQYPDFTIEFEDNKKNDELWDRNRDLFNNIYNHFAKQCALMVVDEILYALTFIQEEIDSLEDFYKEVKQEIEKL